ncbi:hypothetical protein ALQ66_200110 [Pseudomonas savastanoi pv. glycinea]|uniref:Uncharacterized protein n=2 Tax=Pseudomonas syringae group TaxID=136849 RepID=A0A3M3JVR6_PSESG|nr:hypothetical protein ALQ66_200110 [Pseudomonas savastanoi pv. glycinea]RMO28847.1 hypothetical protein ALQ43_200038 [Pseudomonas savastanoi pv. glycinea]RMO38790.1 hypothetical protein ALQ42_200159 [Pseudomonas savastanoi pv. glycinea]
MPYLRGEKLCTDLPKSRSFMLFFNGHPSALSYDGRDYDFTHLHPTNIVFNLLGGVQIAGECRFRSHCYTRELDAGESAKGLIRIDDENGNERYFCPERHQLSLKLGGWMATWCDQKCIQGKHYQHGIENWLIVEDDSGVKVKVAFSIDKHETLALGVMMWIKTTHPYDRSRPDEATRDNSIPFNTLAKTVAHTGKQPKIAKARGGRR